MSALRCIDIAKAAGIGSGIRKGQDTAFSCTRHKDGKNPNLDINEAKNVWFCRVCNVGGDAWELAAFLGGFKPENISAVTEWLKERGLLNGNGPRHEKLDPAWKRIWETTKPMNSPDAAPGRLYFENRGLHFQDYPADIRFAPSLEYYESKKKTGEHPGLVSIVRDRNRNPIGIQRIYLTTQGQKAAVPEPKKSLGPISGGAIYFSEYSDSLNVVEGPETGLAVLLATGLPTCSTVSASGMSKFQIPDNVQTVDVWADVDVSEAGQRAAMDLSQRAHKAGKTVYLRLPAGPIPEGQKSVDWLDVLNAEGPDAFQYAMERDEPWESPKLETEPKKTFSLEDFVMNDQAESMESQMLEDKFVLGRMALLGQSTVFYAKPNAGKTLLVIYLLTRAIVRGEIDGNDVFYVNADDSHKGLVTKLKLAKKHGFKMLAPGYKNFKAEHLPLYLKTLVESNTARGKILILDTVKKFTDLMKKDKVSIFGEAVRQFILHGGTVIMLAHVNKHRDDDNKVVYSGTTDLVDDSDCAYTLDIVTEDTTCGLRTVMFENIKSRGDVARQAVYRYDASDSASYLERLSSVIEVGQQEREAAEKKRRLDKTLAANRLAVDAIKDCIREGFNQKTALINEAHDRSGLSKKKIVQALADHTGNDVTENQFWHVNRMDKNAQVYQLNYSVF